MNRVPTVQSASGAWAIMVKIGSEGDLWNYAKGAVPAHVEGPGVERRGRVEEGAVVWGDVHDQRRKWIWSALHFDSKVKVDSPAAVAQPEDVRIAEWFQTPRCGLNDSSGGIAQSYLHPCGRRAGPRNGCCPPNWNPKHCRWTWSRGV